MRRAARKDGNHAALRTVWRQMGGSWLDIAPDVAGAPDALLGWRGRNVLVEIKDPAQARNKRRLRDNQQIWHASWRGQTPVKIETIQDILKAFKEDL